MFIADKIKSFTNSSSLKPYSTGTCIVQLWILPFDKDHLSSKIDLPFKKD